MKQSSLTRGTNDQLKRNRMKLLIRNENAGKATFSSPLWMLIIHHHTSYATQQLQVVALKSPEKRA